MRKKAHDALATVAIVGPIRRHKAAETRVQTSNLVVYISLVQSAVAGFSAGFDLYFKPAASTSSFPLLCSILSAGLAKLSTLSKPMLLSI